MIELSLGKMVLLALIALIVLGPEKLPGAARTVGALLRRVRSGWDNVKAEVERELEIEEIKRSAREAVASAEAAQQHVKDTLKETHDPFAEAAAMVKLKPSGQNDMPSQDNAADAPLSVGAGGSAVGQHPPVNENQVLVEQPRSGPSTRSPASPPHDMGESHDHP